MQQSGRKPFLLTIGAVTAMVIVVTVIVGIVAYRQVRETMLDQVYGDSITVVERLKTCAMMDAVHIAAPSSTGHGASHRGEPPRTPLDHMCLHIVSMARKSEGYVEVVDFTGKVLASSDPAALYSAPRRTSPATGIRVPGRKGDVALSQLWRWPDPVAGQVVSHGNEPELLALVSVPSVGWNIHYYRSLREVESKVRTVTYPILCILILVILTVPLQAFLFVKTVIHPYVMRPLQKEVQAERAEADALLDAVADGIVVIGTDYKVLRTNRVLEEAYGNRTGQSCYETFFCKTEPCDLCPSRQVFETGKPAQLLRKGSGETSNNGTERERWLETIATPLFGERGEIVASIEVIRDITERKSAEERLAQSARLRALGELAAGIAHEIRTPMNGVTVFLEGVQEEARRIGAPDEMQRDLQLIHEQANRVVGITERILSFAKEESPQLEFIDINRVIERVLEFVDSGLRAQGINVESRLASGLPSLLTNSDELNEVMLNLIVNAQDAMPTGGTLTVETGLENGSIVVRVADTGAGISPEHLPRIFEPGFSTKADQGIAKGLGLGLFLSQGIVESFGGRISVDSSVGKGTTFTLRLPAAGGAMDTIKGGRYA